MAPKGKWKIGLISTAVVVGTTYLVLKTFPHLFTKQDDDDNEVVERTEDDGNQSNKPIELFDSEESFKQK